MFEFNYLLILTGNDSLIPHFFFLFFEIFLDLISTLYKAINYNKKFSNKNNLMEE